MAGPTAGAAVCSEDNLPVSLEIRVRASPGLSTHNDFTNWQRIVYSHASKRWACDLVAKCIVVTAFPNVFLLKRSELIAYKVLPKR